MFHNLLNSLFWFALANFLFHFATSLFPRSIMVFWKCSIILESIFQFLKSKSWYFKNSLRSSLDTTPWCPLLELWLFKPSAIIVSTSINVGFDLLNWAFLIAASISLGSLEHFK